MKVTRTFEIKLVPNKIQKQKLDQYFYEGKVLYNFMLAQEDVFAFNPCKTTEVTKLDKDKNEVPVTLSSLPSKLRQNIHMTMCDSIKGLSAAKKKGNKVGRLKFKTHIESIHIDNQSYRIIDNRHIRLAGFGRSNLRCLGLQQLGSDLDRLKFCGSTLKKTPSGFILHMTIIRDEDNIKYNQDLGIDMGIKDSLTFSTGEKYKCVVEESVRLKKIQRKMAKSLRLNGNKRTNNYRKLQAQLKREYQKLDYKKLEFKRQLMHKFRQYDHIAFQDESLKGWKNMKSNRRTIQHSCLGSIKRELMNRSLAEPDRYICLSKWLPTTQQCPVCNKKNKHELDQRIYKCSCGYTADRDIHAAKNMLIFANLA